MVRYWLVTCKFSFFFNLGEKNSSIVKRKFLSVTKMASTIYETDNCGTAGHFMPAIRVVRVDRSKLLSSREADGGVLLEKLGEVCGPLFCP